MKIRRDADKYNGGGADFMFLTFSWSRPMVAHQLGLLIWCDGVMEQGLWQSLPVEVTGLLRLVGPWLGLFPSRNA